MKASIAFCLVLLVPSLFAFSGCVPGDGSGGSDRGDQITTDGDEDNDGGEDGALKFVAVTFNSGTSEGMGHDKPPDDGYTGAHAEIADKWYGDGLAWSPAIEAARLFFKEVDPDVVVFQEIFWTGECPDIPVEAIGDFVCETWSPGDPTVAQLVLGEGWQVMCHPGKPDKCAAVNERFGSFRGCEEDFCLEGLDGRKIENCGSGARIGRGIIDLLGGGTITLVSVHGSSGITDEDQRCRVRQFEQVFVDLTEGEAAANGEHNLVMGDLNTDPGRLAEIDPSAAYWNDFVGDDKAFHFISDVGPEARATYADLFNIDHVVGDSFTGSCWAAGVSEGHPGVTDAVYFDHVPLVCNVEFKGGGGK